MKKLSIKKLIDFRNKSDRGKKTFVENLKSPKTEAPTEGGGDYWISSLSAVCNAYRHDDLNIIDEKINELQEKISGTTQTITKNMYQRNVAILQAYQRMDLKKLRPGEKLSFLKKSTVNPILTIKGLEVEAKPSHIYTFGKKDAEKIAAIWFIAKVDGYRVEEVGMFCDILHRFLKYNYSKEYQLLPKYCVAIDMLSGRRVDYSEIEDGSFSKVLGPTLDEINKLM